MQRRWISLDGYWEIIASGSELPPTSRSSYVVDSSSSNRNSMVCTQALLAEGKLDPAHEHLVRARQQSLSEAEKTTVFTTLGKVCVRSQSVWMQW